MKYLICGSRTYDNFNDFEEKLSFINWEYDDEIISGGASGADTLVEIYCHKYCLRNTVVKPDWDLFGKSAGFIRNADMIEMGPDKVIAFWDGKSKGTANTIDLARKKKIDTIIFYVGQRG